MEQKTQEGKEIPHHPKQNPLIPQLNLFPRIIVNYIHVPQSTPRTIHYQLCQKNCLETR